MRGVKASCGACGACDRQQPCADSGQYAAPTTNEKLKETHLRRNLRTIPD